jgi:uroporphyrinogen-III synthase
MSLRIFISREGNQLSRLIEFCSKKSWSVIAKSLIVFKSVPFQIPKNWDVVFLPSPRAAQFFLNSCSKLELENKKIACAGSETARSISAYSDFIDFIPANAGNTELVREEFQHWLGNRKVIYAGSNLAKKSVLKNLPENQWEFIHVYDTEFHSEVLPTCDIYIFSSPSNVQSFLSKNCFSPNAKIIAWGKTTAEELRKNKLEIYQTLETSGEEEILGILNKIN